MKKYPISPIEISSTSPIQMFSNSPMEKSSTSTMEKSSNSELSGSSTSNLLPFPFLRLPAELRNIIYEYILTEPHGLQHIHDGDSNRLKQREDPITPPGFATLRESNQLKYVSHQLHSETRGLGVRYNDLYFAHFRAVAQFLPALSAISCTFLGVVNIDMEIRLDGVMPTSVKKLLAQARRLPHVDFKIRVSTWGIYDFKSFFTGFFVLPVLFGKENKYYRNMIFDNEAVQAIVGESLADHQSRYALVRDRPGPANIRLFPIQVKTEYELWIYGLVTNGTGISFGSNGVPGWIIIRTTLQSCYTMAEDIVNDGF